MPVIWLLAVLVYALITKKAQRRKRALICAFILLVFFTNPFTANTFFRLWEEPPADMQSVSAPMTAVVLTGVAMDGPGNTDRVFFSKGADRVLHTVQLYKLGKVNRIIISGGSARLIGKGRVESEQLRTVFIDCGVPDSLIFIERTSRNTYENALYTKKLADSLPLKANYLLVTSAFHMKRAKACFDKVGMKTRIYPVDYHTYSPSNNSFDKLFIPSTEALQKWTTLIHEVAGYIIYKISGYA